MRHIGLIMSNVIDKEGTMYSFVGSIYYKLLSLDQIVHLPDD